MKILYLVFFIINFIESSKQHHLKYINYKKWEDFTKEEKTAQFCLSLMYFIRDFNIDIKQLQNKLKKTFLSIIFEIIKTKLIKPSIIDKHKQYLLNKKLKHHNNFNRFDDLINIFDNVKCELPIFLCQDLRKKYFKNNDDRFFGSIRKVCVLIDRQLSYDNAKSFIYSFYIYLSTERYENNMETKELSNLNQYDINNYLKSVISQYIIFKNDEIHITCNISLYCIELFGTLRNKFLEENITANDIRSEKLAYKSICSVLDDFKKNITYVEDDLGPENFAIVSSEYNEVWGKLKIHHSNTLNEICDALYFHILQFFDDCDLVLKMCLMTAEHVQIKIKNALHMCGRPENTYIGFNNNEDDHHCRCNTLIHLQYNVNSYLF